MEYRKFIPCKQLTPFVECYYVWASSTPLSSPLIIESPPSGYCSIVFNTGSPYFIRNRKYDQLFVPPQFVAGQSIYSYSLHLSGILSLAGIVFKPTALAALYNLRVYEYTEERIDLKTVFDPAICHQYITALAHTADAGEKAHILEQFVLEQYNHALPIPDLIDEAANKIVASNGLIQINELMETTYMSKRTFERNFFRKVGLSPKYYARIRRMSYLTNQIAGKRDVDWHKLLDECAYYDHSHFIKDFLSFTGRSPEQYLKENTELAKIIDKPTPGHIR